MEKQIIFDGLLCVIVLLCYISLQRKNLPYYEIGVDKRGRELITVFVFETRLYRGYYFKKNKNGKYRWKFSVVDWVTVVFIGGLFFGLYAWIVTGNDVIKLDILIFGMLLSVWIFANISSVVAHIYFYKKVKPELQRKKKRK